MANSKAWKPFYQKRGRYTDGRERICIAWYEKGQQKRTLMLPKPEILRELLNSTQKTKQIKGKESVPQNCELSEPKVNENEM